ncbi:hypothetical protein [Nonomuraea roseoviolacea]|uniref:SAF domain-containing protein n=1 Tax=Nonomuraea roseoviolacea subsp. carminata TaxID=160689 RepID=A0ABT1JQK3_9ACTN|nr:hypothetical protein [Nonomuraea roseoviolacea]MCP2344000.1 hypothetical protein [Nonomuraea roseoviolacea subsp. carminata]
MTAERNLPTLSRPRRPGLASLAVLLILGGALGTTLLVMRADDRISVIRVTQQVGAGRTFPLEAMEEALVADPGGEYAPWSDRDRISKRYARVTVLPGSLLTNAMSAGTGEGLAPGKGRVGLALKPGQVPNELQAGYRVQVIHVPRAGSEQGEADLLSPSALVDSVSTPRMSGSTVMATVIVDSAIAPEVAAYASSGEIAIVDLPGER